MIIGHQLRSQRQVRHKEQGEHQPHGNRAAQHPAEQAHLTQAHWRTEQDNYSNPERDSTGEHEGMTPAPAGVKAVRPLSNHGIGHRVHHQCQQSSQSRQATG